MVEVDCGLAKSLIKSYRERFVLQWLHQNVDPSDPLPAECVPWPPTFDSKNLSAVLDLLLAVESKHANNPKVAMTAWPAQYVCPTSEAANLAQIALLSRASMPVKPLFSLKSIDSSSPPAIVSEEDCLLNDDFMARNQGNDHLALLMRGSRPDPASYYEAPPAVGCRPGFNPRAQ